MHTTHKSLMHVLMSQKWRAFALRDFFNTHNPFPELLITMITLCEDFKRLSKGKSTIYYQKIAASYKSGQF